MRVSFLITCEFSFLFKEHYNYQMIVFEKCKCKHMIFSRYKRNVAIKAYATTIKAYILLYVFSIHFYREQKNCILHTINLKSCYFEVH